MHDTAFEIGALAMNIYADLREAAILEVGSHSINGSLRESVPPSTKYVGVDIEAGEGVDLVVEPGKPLPVDDASFDFVMATSVFEHDPCFWVTFLEMCRATSDGGYIYINAPSNGFIHRFPQDNWRFYPDAGRALVKWAAGQGYHITLVESFVADREADVWNDFVAVFRKGRVTKTLPKVFLHEHFNCSNIITWKSKEIIKPRDASEDMLLLNEARERAQSAEADLAAASQARNSLQEQLKTAKEAEATLQMRESELRQRQEEIEQTRRQLIDVQSQKDAASAELLAVQRRVEAEVGLRKHAETAADSWKELYERSQADTARLTEIQRELSNKGDELGRRLKKSEKELERIRKESSEKLGKAESDRRAAELQARMTEAKLAERYNELAILTNLLRHEEDRGERAIRNLEWLTALNDRVRARPAWWLLLPKRWRRQREYRMLQRSGLFDRDSYLFRYPDVAEARVDPLDHYLRHGMQEGRSFGFEV